MEVLPIVRPALDVGHFVLSSPVAVAGYPLVLSSLVVVAGHIVKNLPVHLLVVVAAELVMSLPVAGQLVLSLPVAGQLVMSLPVAGQLVMSLPVRLPVVVTAAHPLFEDSNLSNVSLEVLLAACFSLVVGDGVRF